MAILCRAAKNSLRGTILKYVLITSVEVTRYSSAAPVVTLLSDVEGFTSEEAHAFLCRLHWLRPPSLLS
jgi:hypothetical protein